MYTGMYNQCIVCVRCLSLCRQCCEFMLMMVQLWPTQTLERHVATLQDAIKKGINDPDPDARLLARRYVANHCVNNKYVGPPYIQTKVYASCMSHATDDAHCWPLLGFAAAAACTAWACTALGTYGHSTVLICQLHTLSA